MNRIKRRRKQKFKKIFVSIFCFLLISLLISSAYSLFSQQIKIEGNVSFGKSDLKKCEGDIEFEITSWNNNNRNYYKIVFTLTNNSTNNYNDWNVYFDVPEDAILESYSSTTALITGTKIKASSLYYNSTILSKDSIQFEIQISTKLENYEPTNINLNNCFNNNESTTTDNLDITFNLTSTYGQYYYIYDVVVKNIGNDTIKNWSFEIDKSESTKLIDYWNVNYISKNNSIVFSSMTYNGTIAPSDSIVFGIVINTDDSSYVPSLVGDL